MKLNEAGFRPIRELRYLSSHLVIYLPMRLCRMWAEEIVTWWMHCWKKVLPIYGFWIFRIRRWKEQRYGWAGGRKAQLVHWVSRSILEFEPSIKFELWHDRATFHFLHGEDEITRYITLADKSIADNGNLIISTFSNEGPPKCSGLDVRRYSEESLSERFSPLFQKRACFTENHTTPFNPRFCSQLQNLPEGSDETKFV